MPDCNACKSARKGAEPVPFIVHEADMARQQSTIHKLWVVLIILIVLLFGTNLGWLIYESQFADVVTEIDAEQTAEGGGNNTVVGGDYYGEAEGPY